MDLSLSALDIAFRDEVRAFFAERLTPEFRQAGARLTSAYADPDASRAWQYVLFQQGWAAPSWPGEHGGCNWTPAQHRIFAKERADAAAPPLSPMGVGMIGPVLIRHGSQAQKAFFLRKTLSGEIFWCQGYSEPDSGSDLASLQMRAHDDGDSFVCNGVKTWSTYAHVADWMFKRGAAPARHHLPPDRHALARHRSATHHQPGWRAHPEFDLLHRRARAEEQYRWRDRRRLDDRETPSRIRARR
jgi:alkylation response protein AidB-like acyl-CoA dehydrogenase